MKQTVLHGLAICLFFLAGLAVANGQQTQKTNKKEVRVVKRTVMEQYEPEMVQTAEDRVRLKKERLAIIEKRLSIIDTLKISDRKKRSLLRELYSSPHSHKWERLIADLEFVDDDTDY